MDDRTQRKYQGVREVDGCQITVIDTPGGPGRELRHIIRHSPTGLEWGYGGSGPADTALSILTDYLGREPHPTMYQRYKFLAVGAWPRDAFTTTGADIDLALERIRRDTGRACMFCADRGYVETAIQGVPG
jgi:hypothetical protein